MLRRLYSQPMSSDPSSPKPDERSKSKALATLHDVAVLAGVSTMTVSRALKSPKLIAPTTLRRIQDAVAKTKYVPNALAGGLRAARRNVVAALVPTLQSHLYDATIQSLTDALSAAGYQLLVGQTGHSGAREEALLYAIVSQRPDGVVITGVVHSKAARAMLLASGIPVVETNDWTTAPLDMLVGFSNEEMGADACRYLAQKGRKRLAIVCGDDSRARRRATSFQRAASTLGLVRPSVEIVPAPTSHLSGRTAMAKLLRRGDVDAVYCGSDIAAMGAITEARAQGIDVPTTVAVLGSGNMDFSASFLPSISTVHVDFARVGTLAANLILDRVEGREIDSTAINVGYSIIERESA